MMKAMTEDATIHCAECPVAAAAAGNGGACPFIRRPRDRGDLVCTAGEPALTIWFVARGAVVLSRTGAGEMHVDRARAVRRCGDFVGLEALVRPTYLDSARVTAPAILCGAGAAAIDRWLGPEGTPARMALAQTLRTACEEPPRASRLDGTALVRVAGWLVQEAERGGGADVPRRYLAGVLGVVPETLSRVLARLGATGAVVVTRREVRIADLDALRAIAGRPSRAGATP